MNKEFTHEEISQRSGVSRTYITMLILGQRRATEKTAKKLEAASGWSWLFWAHPTEFDRSGNPLPAPEAPPCPPH